MATASADNPLLAAALDYIARGWYVFPLHAPARKGGGCTCGRADCTNQAKHPITLHGLKDATLDAEQIRQWWGRWTFANVGVVTGAKSGLLALDIDSHKGGVESFSAIQARYGPLVDTLMSNTGSGGAHLLYAHPGGDTLLPNKQRLDGYAGLDVRGDGGYIVAPPSRHASGALYEWNLPDAPVRAAADWLLRLLSSERRDAPLLQSRAERQPGDANALDTREAISYWTHWATQRAVVGDRNGTAFWWACQLRDAGVSEADAEGATQQFYDGLADSSDFSPREVDRAVRNAYRGAVRDRAQSLEFRSRPGAVSFQGRAMEDQGDPRDTPPSERPYDSADEAQQQHRQTRFQFLTVQQVKDQPTPTWLIDRILPAKRLSIIFGDYGSYKSFLALDFALCVATGVPWCGHVVEQGPVAYIAGEGIGGMGLRIRAWESQHPGAPPPDQLWMLGTAPQLLVPQDVAELVVAVGALPQAPSFVIIDTLARSMVGGDEVSSEVMGRAVHAAEQLQAGFGCHVLLVHHKPKSGNGTRGHTSLPGAADAMIEVTKDGQLVTVRCEKQKDAKEFDKLYMRPHVVALDEHADLSSVILLPRSSGEPVQTGPLLAPSAQHLIELMRTHFPTGGRYKDMQDAWLAKKLGPTSSFNNARDRLVDTGLLTNTGGFYTLSVRDTNSSENE
jgi:Bifunctional DNA primase/polymerase, N-terminal/AAA domain